MNQNKITLNALKGGPVYANPFDDDKSAYEIAVKNVEFAAVEKFSRDSAVLIGQDHAVQAIKESLYAASKPSKRRGVKDVLVFAGSPGTGKTALCEIVAKASSVPSKVFNLAAFNDKEASLFDLFGINASYKSAKNGLVTEFAYINPFSLIVFDEVEKAHPNVLRVLMGMLEDGCVHDACMGIDVDFSNVTVVFATNVGKAVYDRNAGVYNFANVSKSEILQALRTEINPMLNAPYFSDALVSRFSKGKVIMFNKLRPEVLRLICEKRIAECKREYEEKFGTKIIVDEVLLASLMVFSQGGEADARSVMGEIEEFFARNVTRAVQISREKGVLVLKNINVIMDIDNASLEAKRFYVDQNLRRVLIYGLDKTVRLVDRCKPSTVELRYDDKSESIVDMDLSAVIIDVTGKDEAEAKRIFRAAIGLESVPVYVYSEQPLDKSDFLYYTDHGAVEVYSPKINNEKLTEWMCNKLEGLTISHVKQGLLRSNKVFYCGKTQIEMEENSVATIIVGDIDVQTVRASGDNRVLAEREIPTVSFDDVIGADSAKKLLANAVKYLKNPRKYAREGNRIPRGIILQGEPGTGKTMLARAVAGAAGVPFISVTGAEFHNKWQGEGARMIRETFAEARRYAPSIIFIDEIDAIAKSRMSGDLGGANVDSQLNTLLTEMDGFSTNKSNPVLVIAATNFDLTKGESKLDPALLRRFDVKVTVPLPDKDQRKLFLQRLLSKKSRSEVSNQQIELLSKRSAGWNLAELELVVENAIRALGDGEALGDGRLIEEYERYVSGDKRSRSEAAVRRTSIHEAGHAVVATLLGEKPSFATVSPRASFGGYVEMVNEGRDSYSKSELRNLICISMAGRAAEKVFFGEDGERTGVAADLRSATDTALKMICEYGMDEDMMFSLTLDKPLEQAWIREKVHAMISAEYNSAIQLVTDNVKLVEAVADRLMQKSYLDGAEIELMVSNR